MTYHHTQRCRTAKAKIAITLDEAVLKRIDRLVEGRAYPNRSHAIEEAVQEKLQRMDRSQLARELAMLDPGFERAIAEEGLSGDLSEWPEY